MRNEKGQFLKGYHQPTQFKKGAISLNKGKKASLKTRQKQREAKLKNPTKCWQGKLREAMRGNKYNFGKKHTMEWKIKNGERRKGENNPRWRGGITPLNKKIRGCFEMRQWRSDVFTRDDFICQSCGQRGGELQADHIKLFSVIMKDNNITCFEDALGCRELWNLNNGQTLCKDCHSRKTYNVEGIIRQMQ